MGANIPEARVKLTAVAKELQAVCIKPGRRKQIGEEIDKIIRSHMIRSYPETRRKPTSPAVDPVIEEAVLRTVERNPEMPQHKVAEVHNLNPGRVSEILSRRRREGQGDA